MAKTVLKVGGAVFFLVALGHLSRLIFKFNLMIGYWDVPVWVNGVGFLVALGLSFWMFKAEKSL